ncbi:MAG: hypothetical protein RL347_2272 [Actinomycetota bacterium]|jgi:superfamily II DNA/RNA helicase
MSTTRTSTRPPADSSFASLGVPSLLVEVLSDQGITSPFPIQAVTLPDSLTGRDVLGRGRTGSGKTIAFALPLITRLSTDRQRTKPHRPRGLVLLPTRELAAQVQATMEPLARAAGLSTTTIYGGVSQRPQVAALSRGVDIVVACPGRLEDLMKQGHIHLDDVAVTVIDEADHMADLGFLPAVKRILDRTPKGGQRLLFSATLDRGVDTLVKKYLSNPITHSVDSDATTEPDMEHHVLTVRATDKPQIVRELAAGKGRSVLFVRTKHQAKKLARTLTLAGIPAVDLQGNLAQKARERNMEAFRCGDVKVLVATDIAARGIHVDDVELVVHVDPPTEHKAYLHRSGRTARAGASGVVVTLQTSDQAADVTAMTRKAGISVTAQRTVPGAPQLLELTGPRAAHVAPMTETAPATHARAPRSTGAHSRHGRRRRSSSTRRAAG